jgi:glycosyltransferase involved in cell wall biosynthesis
MISFIVPAHNEERWIGRCVASIRASMQSIGEPYEVIVVNDASTDATPRMAVESGARVLNVALRKISAVRNAGAREASGDIFFFVDADTQVNEATISAGLAALRAGAAGGGCVFEFDGRLPLWSRMVHRFATVVARIIRWVGGCFIFCTREAYAATGGFSEQLYAGEDIAFVQALKKVGRFVVPKPTVITSGRKIAVVSFWDVMVLVATIAVRGPNYDSVIIRDILYGRRAQESKERAEAA